MKYTDLHLVNAPPLLKVFVLIDQATHIVDRSGRNQHVTDYIILVENILVHTNFHPISENNSKTGISVFIALHHGHQSHISGYLVPNRNEQH